MSVTIPIQQVETLLTPLDESKDESIEVVVHTTTAEKERQKAALELLAKHPEIFETGLFQTEVNIPNITSTEADIIVEGAKQFRQWKHFMVFIFQIYPHNDMRENIRKAENLWPYVLLMQGRDPESEE
jgi:hypothetical protein